MSMTKTKMGSSYNGVKDPNFMGDVEYQHSPDTTLYTPLSNGGFNRTPIPLSQGPLQKTVSNTAVELWGADEYGEVITAFNGSGSDDKIIHILNDSTGDIVTGDHDVDDGDFAVFFGKSNPSIPIKGPIYAKWTTATASSWVSYHTVKYQLVDLDNDGA